MPENLDINVLRGAVLILLIIGFVGIWAWAWSKNRKPDFDALSRLPLEEDDGIVPRHEENNGHDHASQGRT